MKPPKLYLDSSIYNALSVQEMQIVTRALLDRCANSEFQPCVSALVVLEIAESQSAVAAMEQLLTSAAVLPVTESILRMREAYLQSEILGRDNLGAAMQVAVASAGGCKLMATWRFDEILRYDRIPRYNALNEAWGFPHLPMHSPLSLLSDLPDHVKFTRPQVSDAVNQAVAGLPLEQELAFWAERTAELQERQKTLKKEQKKAEKAEVKKPEKAAAK